MTDSQLRFEHPAPGILRSVFRGELGEEEVSSIITEAGAVLEREGRITLFHDWEGMTRYTPSVRTRLTTWAATHRDRIDGLHILLEMRGPVMSMAVAASNLVLGGMMHIHQKRAPFERDYRVAVSNARRDAR